MKMSCPERKRYISNAHTLSGLGNRLNEAIEEIRNNLSNVAQNRNSQRALPLKRRSDGQIIQILPDHIQIWILEKKTWHQVFEPNAARGAYIPCANKILLEDDNWCRKTIVHEALHSVSIFSDPSNKDTYEMTRLFAEGATEFLTGLLLFRRHQDCYDNWRLACFPHWCSVSYPKETRTFLAFCGCADSQSLMDLYFGTQTRDLSAAWTEFTTAIRRKTGKPFKDVFQEGKRIDLTMAFKNECERQFGKKFRKLQKLFDYGRVF